MAFVRVFGKFSSNPSVRNSLLNKGIHQIAISRMLSMTAVSSAAVQKSSVAKGPPPAQSNRKDILDTTFNDPIAAFKSKTTFELMRGYFVYLICSSETLVANNMKVSGA